jgi:hypothetical protein
MPDRTDTERLNQLETMLFCNYRVGLNGDLPRQVEIRDYSESYVGPDLRAAIDRAIEAQEGDRECAVGGCKETPVVAVDHCGEEWFRFCAKHDPRRREQ